jgi:CRISPR type III-B/RAMP module RAMP protein Cmr6
MAIPILQATSTALGGASLPRCTSRALFAARFADPAANDEKNATPRKDWFHRLMKIPAEKAPRPEWLPEGSRVVHARLMSRLLVDLAGGVMENANVNLDRYGLPRIPGSAVKGCARRMALQALHDWAGGDDDLTAPLRDGFAQPAAMLAAIARIFGWVETDWPAHKNRDRKTHKETTWKSDFAWACAGALQTPDPEAVAHTLCDTRAMLPAVKAFAGSISFLDAFPNFDPGLELDVVTPHHTKYHEGKDPAYATAPDTEEPIPVFFPAVKPQKNGDFFSFPLIRLPRATETDLDLAASFLAKGLELFGLGAKTNAGYGWFLPLVDGVAVDPLSKLLPPAGEAELMLKNWKGRVLNSMSIRGFVKEAAEIISDSELVEVFRAMAGDHLVSISGKEDFWRPFYQSPVGKALVERLKNAISAEK